MTFDENNWRNYNNPTPAKERKGTRKNTNEEKTNYISMIDLLIFIIVSFFVAILCRFIQSLNLFSLTFGIEGRTSVVGLHFIRRCPSFPHELIDFDQLHLAIGYVRKKIIVTVIIIIIII